MFSTAALIAYVVLGPADFSAATQPVLAELPSLRVQGAPLAREDLRGSLRLHVPLLERSERARRPTAMRAAQAPAGGGVSAGGGSVGPGGTPAASGAGEVQAGAQAPSVEGAASATPGEGGGAAQAPTEEEPSIDLLRQRRRLTQIHRPLGIATWSSLLVTTTLGTIAAINQRTIFGQGNCAMTGEGVLGRFGCEGLSPLHGLSAFVTVSLYATTGIFALSMPDPERVTSHDDRRGARLRLHRAMAWVHFAGMVLQPILGMLSAFPGMIGLTVDPTAPIDEITRASERIQEYQAVMRTVHLGVGYITLAALTTAMILEL